MNKFRTAAAIGAVVSLLGFGASAAHARSDVYWSIGIQAPTYPGSVGVTVGNAPRWGVPVYSPAPVYVSPAPVYVAPPRVVYGQPYPHRGSRDWRDHDRDGVPNWRDRNDHSRQWHGRDRDRDGRPDWRDHSDNRDWRDRDRDGTPNWRDRRDNRPHGERRWRDD
jgi:hypothetical protein